MPFMRQAAAHLDMSPGLYRVVGALEVAGAVGLLLGLASAPLGVAAGGGRRHRAGAAGDRGRGCPPAPRRPARAGPARRDAVCRKCAHSAHGARNAP
ncbi:DoxX family protein [Streptomyces sp. NPDC050121]|uniref:DoxX family protein n=1 Tax=Streptomyces sp. NPDC050121 TaxID=3365601 RepID=UPI0037A8C316